MTSELDRLLDEYRAALLKLYEPAGYAKRVNDARAAIVAHFNRASEGGEDARLQFAREAARYKAWLDLLDRFTNEQEQHVAVLLAHDWYVAEIVLRIDDGRPHDREHIIGARDPSQKRSLLGNLTADAARAEGGENG